MPKLGFDKDAKHFTHDGVGITLTSDQKAEMERLTWWQSMPFNKDCTSNGQVSCAGTLKKYWLDKVNLTGQSVLGIGCFEGFQLFFAEAQGATRVVGLTEDFGLNPGTGPAREFTRKVLKSKVEFVDRSIYDLTPAELGQFDVVFFFDALPHQRHPLLALERVAAMSRAVIFVCTPFIIATDPNPWAVLLPNFNNDKTERNLSGVNQPWVDHAINRLGFQAIEKTIHEIDYVSVVAARNENSSVIQSLAEAELPTDQGMEDKTAILVMSCERYKQVWDPFFTLFKKYFPDCPYKVYFCTDHGSVNYPWVKNIELGIDRQWAGNTKQALAQIDAEQIILLQEDFLLNRPADTQLLRKLCRHALDVHAGCIRLRAIPRPSGSWSGTPILGTIGPFDDFRYSFQLTMWNKRVLSSLLSEGDDPWTTEFVAARRSVFCPEPFLSLIEEHKNPIPYLAYAVDQGEWTDSAMALLKREEIPMDGITKRIARIQRK